MLAFEARINVYASLLSKFACFSQAGKFCDVRGAFQLKMRRKMYVSNEVIGFLDQRKIVLISRRLGFSSWVVEKGIEICYEMLFWFAIRPNAKSLIVPKKISQKSEQNLYPPLPSDWKKSNRNDELSKPHKLNATCFLLRGQHFQRIIASWFCH